MNFNARSFIFVLILVGAIPSYAAYYETGVIIKNTADAYITCSKTCSSRLLGRWTGEWWTTSRGDNQVSVCECLYDWPYCPYIRPGANPWVCTIRPSP